MSGVRISYPACRILYFMKDCMHVLYEHQANMLDEFVTKERLTNNDIKNILMMEFMFSIADDVTRNEMNEFLKLRYEGKYDENDAVKIINSIIEEVRY